MPRYYFNVRSYSDGEGTELGDDTAAREYALESARQLVYADIKNGWLNLDHRIDVVDKTGALVLTVTFRDAFEVSDNELKS